MLKGLLKLTWLELKIFLREPLGVIGSIVVPVAVFLVLGVHSLLYAGFFEDPLTWGVMGLASAALAGAPAASEAREDAAAGVPAAPELLAH